MPDKFSNIEHARPGRSGATWYGYTPSQRTFSVFIAPKAAAAQRWVARALTPRDGLVNEFRGPTMAAISEHLRSLP